MGLPCSSRSSLLLSATSRLTGSSTTSSSALCMYGQPVLLHQRSAHTPVSHTPPPFPNYCTVLYKPGWRLELQVQYCLVTTPLCTTTKLCCSLPPMLPTATTTSFPRKTCASWSVRPRMAWRRPSLTRSYAVAKCAATIEAAATSSLLISPTPNPPPPHCLVRSGVSFFNE